MKLTIFNPANSGRLIPKGEPVISFNSYGQINLSIKLCEAMKLKSDDRIVIANDEDRPKDWYIIHRADGFALRQLKDSAALVTQSSPLAKRIISQFAATGKKSIRFKVATIPSDIEGVSCYAILTSSAPAK